MVQLTKKSVAGGFTEFTLASSELSVTFSTLGGIVSAIVHRGTDVALGYDAPEKYLAGSPYFGCLVGRYANRIGNGGTFEIDGKKYSLANNNAPAGKPCALHGGVKGFDKVTWTADAELQSEHSAEVRLKYISADGEEGYPGTLTVFATYRVTDKHEWIIEYQATTDKTTVVNLTQHAYFNLAGEGTAGDILGHRLRLDCGFFIPVDEGLIPSGEVLSVAGTPFDFRDFHTIGERIGDTSHPQIAYGNGYDHTFVASGQSSVAGTFKRIATVEEPTSGRTMEVFTTEPGVQFYSGNFLDGKFTGKTGKSYSFRSGFCLETGHFPHSPNVAHFPSTLLRPNETYKSTTAYRFSFHK